MEWEFTPEDVVKGRSGYDLAEFRRDLAEEVRQNVGEGEFQRCYDLIYDLCYALATSQDIETHYAGYAYDPPTVRFLRGLEPLMAGNAAMLGAIFQRRIMDKVEAGMPLEAAVGEVAAWHGQSLTRPGGRLDA